MEIQGDPAALDTLRAALRLASEPTQRLRLLVQLVWLDTKFGIPDDLARLSDARRLADSIVRVANPTNSIDADLMARLAALTGRCATATRLTRLAAHALAAPVVQTQQNIADIDARAVLVTLGCTIPSSLPSIDQIADHVGLASLSPAMRPIVESDLFARLIRNADTLNVSWGERLAPRDYLIAARTDLAHGRRDSARTRMLALDGRRRGGVRGDFTPDAALPEARVWLALGDTARAVQWLYWDVVRCTLSPSHGRASTRGQRDHRGIARSCPGAPRRTFDHASRTRAMGERGHHLVGRRRCRLATHRCQDARASAVDPAVAVHRRDPHRGVSMCTTLSRWLVVVVVGSLSKPAACSNNDAVAVSQCPAPTGPPPAVPAPRPDAAWPPPDFMHLMPTGTTTTSAFKSNISPQQLDSMHFIPPLLAAFSAQNNWCTAEVPEFQDAQRFLVPGQTFGPVVQVVAAPNLADFASAAQFESGYVAAAIAYVWGPPVDVDGPYKRLHLVAGLNCVYLHHDAPSTWSAQDLPPGFDLKCGGPGGAALIAVTPDAPTVSPGTIPPVTRFVQASDTMTFIGVRCGHAGATSVRPRPG